MGKLRKTLRAIKTRVVLATIQNDCTIAQIANRFGVHPTMVASWKRKMFQNAASTFDKNHNCKKQA